MDASALFSKTLHLQPAELLIQHEANKTLLTSELSSREMECFVSGIILQRKYAPFNSDSVHQEFGWRTRVFQLDFVSSCTVALLEILQYTLAQCSVEQSGQKWYRCCVADTRITRSAKKFCFKRLKPPLTGRSSGLDRVPCVKLNIKT